MVNDTGLGCPIEYIVTYMGCPIAEIYASAIGLSKQTQALRIPKSPHKRGIVFYI